MCALSSPCFYCKTTELLHSGLRKPDQMKTVISSRVALRSHREQFFNCCFAITALCQPATLSLNDKHSVLFWAIRKTAAVTRTVH